MSAATNTSVALVALPDNRHQSSRDSNPYAYPYFLSQSGSVYDAVVQFASAWVDGDTAQQRELLRSIESTCFSSPQDLAWQDSCGDTALHRLAQFARLSGGATAQNVNFLIRIANTIVDADQGLVLMQNNWKETPLQQFVNHCGMPPCVDASTEFTDKDARLFRKLLTILCAGNAARVPNYTNCYPLHEAVRTPSVMDPTSIMAVSGSSHGGCFDAHRTEVVKMLLKLAPSAILEDDHNGDSPVCRAIKEINVSPSLTQVLLECRAKQQTGDDIMILPQFSNSVVVPKKQTHWAHAIRHLYAESSMPIDNHYSSCNTLEEYKAKTLELMTESPLFNSYWQKLNMIAEVHSKSFLHGLILLGASHDMILAGLSFVSSIDDALLLLVDDATEHTVLTLFLKMALSSSSFDNDDEMRNIIQMMIGCNKAIATIPDVNGRLPIMLAATATTRDMKWDTGIQDIHMAFPPGSYCPDPITQLFPFQLAATVADDHDGDDVDTIYELLRFNPSMIADSSS
mmetsp:Transcript_21822/g.62158  ORF Transcript_21822/g.62158 Transcript_21822/m.62158 type:complete len:513 (-) Transcript_21822:109-1647(-)